MADSKIYNHPPADEWVAAPIRSLDDFLLGSARFQVPPFQDLNRLSNRITSNLLYYQSNYFIMIAAACFIMSALNPRDVVIGLFCVLVNAGIAFYLTTKHPAIFQFKKEHQLLSVALALVGGWLLFSTIGSVVVFLFSLLFPLMTALIHASMRLRSIKNKIANKAEAVGVTKTIMGCLLEMLGLKPVLIVRLD